MALSVGGGRGSVRAVLEENQIKAVFNFYFFMSSLSSIVRSPVCWLCSIFSKSSLWVVIVGQEVQKIKN